MAKNTAIVTMVQTCAVADVSASFSSVRTDADAKFYSAADADADMPD